jgi:serine/threonine protein kinase
MHSKLSINTITWLTTCSVEYRLISKKGEGTFSEVLKAQSIKTGKYVAIKCMKAHFYNIDQVSYKNSHNYSLGQQSSWDLST